MDFSTEQSELSPYIIRTEVFEGPVALLASLIESRKLFINEISLAEVTADYVEYVRQMAKIEVVEVSSFVSVAATLLLIKSRSLMPNISLTPDEEDTIDDLENRLVLYQIIDAGAKNLRRVFGKTPLFPSGHVREDEPLYVGSALITQENLYKVLSAVFNRLPKETEPLPEIAIQKVVSLEEMIDSLSLRIERALSTSFNSLVSESGLEGKREVKVYAIVSFLAILELVRGGLIDVMQEGSFDDIRIEKSYNEITI